MTNFQAQFSKQAEDFMNAAREVRMPESVQAFAEDSIVRSRDAYAKLTTVTKDAAVAINEVADLAQVNVKALGDKVVANTVANTEAAFDAARDLARSRSLPEAWKVQSDFFQSQMAKIGEQTREFFELTAALTQKTIESKPAAAAAKAFRQAKA